MIKFRWEPQLAAFQTGRIRAHTTIKGKRVRARNLPLKGQTLGHRCQCQSEYAWIVRADTGAQKTSSSSALAAHAGNLRSGDNPMGFLKASLIPLPGI